MHNAPILCVVIHIHSNTHAHIHICVVIINSYDNYNQNRSSMRLRTHMIITHVYKHLCINNMESECTHVHLHTRSQ